VLCQSSVVVLRQTYVEVEWVETKDLVRVPGLWFKVKIELK
jgi:hypothetical protein